MTPLPMGYVFAGADVLDGRSPKVDHGLNHIRRVVTKDLVAERHRHWLAVIYRRYVPVPWPTGRPDHYPVTICWLDLRLLDERGLRWTQSPDVREYVTALDPYIIVEITPAENGVEQFVVRTRDRRMERQRWDLVQRRGRAELKKVYVEELPYPERRST